MNDIQIFDYNNKMIRTVEHKGETWWVLKDVCKALKISKYRDTANRLDEDERELFEMDTLGGKQKMIVINESGLYNVIIRSDKPEAKPFRKWVTNEVLPSIRRTGSYSINKNTNQNDFTMINDLMQTMFTAQQETNNQLIQVLNLISSTLPKPYEPPYTRWIKKTYEKVDKIATSQDLERKNILHRIFQELQDTYDIDLSEYEYEFCQLHNIPKAYTINVINADNQLKQWFDIILDTILENLIEYKLDENNIVEQKECIYV